MRTTSGATLEPIDRPSVEKAVVEQPEQPGERIGLPGVWGRRKQQQPRCGVGKMPAELVTSDVLARARDVVRFVDDDQVPPGVDDGLDASVVVLSDPIRPSIRHDCGSA